MGVPRGPAGRENRGRAIALAAGIQLLENYVLVPKIMREVVGLSPFATIIGLIAGFELFGIAGALLAVPMAAALASHAPLSDGGPLRSD